MDNNVNQQHSGTGSAEQTGRDRSEQQSGFSSNETDKSTVASQIDEKESDIKTIADLGGMSGRDDAAGGSGERMETQNTGEPTDDR